MTHASPPVRILASPSKRGAICVPVRWRSFSSPMQGGKRAPSPAPPMPERSQMDRAQAVYPSDPSDALADLRHQLERYPEAVFAETASLACVLRRPDAEVEAAREWLIEEGLEVRA